MLMDSVLLSPNVNFPPAQESATHTLLFLSELDSISIVLAVIEIDFELSASTAYGSSTFFQTKDSPVCSPAEITPFPSADTLPQAPQLSAITIPAAMSFFVSFFIPIPPGYYHDKSKNKLPFMPLGYHYPPVSKVLNYVFTNLYRNPYFHDNNAYLRVRRP